MPVFQPTYSDHDANSAFNDVLALLKEKYRIQVHKPSTLLKADELRRVRNEKLREAIHSLFELESWESF